MSCDRPEFTASDSITVNCRTSGASSKLRDNYALLPFGVAPMAPSGPINWNVKNILKYLELVAESCRKSYDPLRCIDNNPGFWQDLAAVFRAHRLKKLVDLGSDSENNCFYQEDNTLPIYTIPPIDPNAIRTFNYPWGRFFRMKYYYRPAPGGVRPAPPESPTWGVYQLYEYGSGPVPCEEAMLVTECRFVALSMQDARNEFGYESPPGPCQYYPEIDPFNPGPGKKKRREFSKEWWEITEGTDTFKLNKAEKDFITESEAKNLAKKLSNDCAFYVYQIFWYETRCSGTPLCECHFEVLMKDLKDKCIKKEDATDLVKDITPCPEAENKWKYVKFKKRSKAFDKIEEAEAERDKLQAACNGSSSSGVVRWYVYHLWHYDSAECAGNPKDICDYQLDTDGTLDLQGCIDGVTYDKVGEFEGYETYAEAEEVLAELREECPWYVYKKDEYTDEGCSGDVLNDCLYIVTQTVYKNGDCYFDEEASVHARYYWQATKNTKAEADAVAEQLTRECQSSSSSSGSSSSGGGSSTSSTPGGPWAVTLFMLALPCTNGQPTPCSVDPCINRDRVSYAEVTAVPSENAQETCIYVDDHGEPVSPDCDSEETTIVVELQITTILAYFNDEIAANAYAEEKQASIDSCRAESSSDW